MAEYNGSIELIAGLKQANNNDFPLVHSKDVYTDITVDDIQCDNVQKALEKLNEKGVKLDEIFGDERYTTLSNLVSQLNTVVLTGDLDGSESLQEAVARLDEAIKNSSSNYKIFYNLTSSSDSILDEQTLYLYESESEVTDGSDIIIEGPERNVISTTFIASSVADVAYKISLSRLGLGAASVIKYGADALIGAKFNVLDSLGESMTGSNGTITCYVNNKKVASQAVAVGSDYNINVAPYLNSGSNSVYLEASWSQGDNSARNATIAWTINAVSIYMTSGFQADIIYNGSIPFSAEVFGAGLRKTVHLILDGEEVDTAVVGTSNGVTYSYNIPAQSHGSHNIEVYCTAYDSSNNLLTSDSLYYDIITLESGNTTPVIKTNFDYLPIEQYDNKNISYMVYTPGVETSNVSISIQIGDGEVEEVSKLVVDRTSQVFSYRPGAEVVFAKDPSTGEYTEDSKNVKIIFKTGEVVKELNVEITRFPYEINQITSGLVLDFNPTGRSNNDNNYNEFSYLYDEVNDLSYSWEPSTNFDWINGGWKTDEKGDSYFLVKAGTTVKFDCPLFGDISGNSATSLGREFKIIYKVDNVRKTDSSFLTCLSDSEIPYGLDMRPHETFVSSSGGTVKHPLSEQDIIEWEFNLNPSSAEIPMIMTYEDGVGAFPLIYDPVGDRFNHKNGITIGSTECDVYIYRMKVYSAGLSDKNILNNFYADARTAAEMKARYIRNQIYDPDADSTLYVDNLTPESVANACPDLRVITIKAPHFTSGKKYFIGETEVECIYKNGTHYYDNWTAKNCFHSGQGTSSDAYGLSGRNIDIYMCIDGEYGSIKDPDGNKYSGARAEELAGGKTELTYSERIYVPVKNPVIEDLLEYFILQDDKYVKIQNAEDYIETEVVEGEEGQESVQKVKDGTYYIYTDTITDGTGKIQLSETSYPNNIFNIKVNIASSENANNALLQKRFDRYMPYTPLSRKRDPRVKNSMEFYNCVIFIQETDENLTTHREFNDNKIHFYGIGNIGDSKKSDGTRANDPKDKDEFTIEITDWNNPLSNWPGLEEFVAVSTADAEDTEADPSKQYYNGLQYLLYYNDKNISKFYELIDGEYIPTEDETVVNHVSVNEKGKLEVDKTYYIKVKDAIYLETFDDDWNYDARYKGKNKAYKYVWPEFYKFIVRDIETPEDIAKWKQEFQEWFVDEGNAAFYWYLFTLRYTMVDNRGKNTFWHWGKTGVFHEVSNPIELFLRKGYYAEEQDGKYVTIAANAEATIDPEKTYYCQYGFDFWDYDNDTSLGIDNTGVLNMDYGVEDFDYDESGAAYFRCHDSTPFVRMRQYFASDLARLYNTIAVNATACWSANDLINEFDKWQEEFSEELWRLDIQRKYIRPYNHGSEGQASAYYGSDKADPMYLKEKMNGRKKYQRRQFERNQEFYMASKFFTDSIQNDTIQFRGSGAEVTTEGLTPDWTMTITPYSNMYLRVDNGQKTALTQRVYAGQPVTFQLANQTEKVDLVYIYGASHISSIGDLSRIYVESLSIGLANKLQSLVLGNANPLYSNLSLPSISFGSNGLLESIDVQNITNLAGTLDVSNCNALQTLKAQGTALTGVSFSKGGMLKEAHLPATLTNLTLQNLEYLTNVDLAGIEKLTTVNIENCPYLDRLSFDLAVNAVNNWNKDNVDYSLVFGGINWPRSYGMADDSILDKLYNLNTVFKNNCNVHVSTLGTIQYDKYVLNTDNPEDTVGKWRDPEDLHLTYDGDLILYHTVEWKNWDGELLKSELIMHGSNVYAPEDLIPTKPSDIQYDYAFSGWDVTVFPQQVDKNMTFFAQFDNKTLRKYTVTWTTGYGSNGELAHAIVDYGASVEYPNEALPTQPSTYNRYYLFSGWDKPTSFISGDTIVNATWSAADIPSAEGTVDEYGLTTKNTDLSDMSATQIYAILNSDGTIDRFLNPELEDFKAGRATINIQLGYMPDYQDVESIVIVGDKEKDNSLEQTPFTIKKGTAKRIDLQPLAEDTSWTLAIDFEPFYNASGTNLSLVSCYSNTNTTGFRLCMDSPAEGGMTLPQIKWGAGSTAQTDSWVAIDNRGPRRQLRGASSTEYNYKTFRNIVVLEHEKGSSQLKVYSNNRNTLDEIKLSRLVGSTNYITNAKLCLGGMDSSLTNPLEGNIYYMKYWDAALGENECKKIANWIYEKEEFKCFSTKSSSTPYYLGENVVNASFIATNLIDRGVALNGKNKSRRGGFGAMPLCEWLNSKYIKAFPLEWQQILSKATIRYNNMEPSPDGKVGLDVQTSISKDMYVTIPDYRDVTNLSSALPEPSGRGEVIPWMLDNQQTELKIATTKARPGSPSITAGNANIYWTASGYNPATDNGNLSQSYNLDTGSAYWYTVNDSGVVGYSASHQMAEDFYNSSDLTDKMLFVRPIIFI